MTRLNVLERPECIWNVDETNLFIEAQRTTVVARSGEKCSRVTATSGREAFTIEAAISAAGDLMDPLVVSRENTLWSTGDMMQHLQDASQSVIVAG